MVRIGLAIGEELDTAEVQSTVESVVDETSKVLAPIIFGGDVAHEVQSDLVIKVAESLCKETRKS